MEKDAPE
jgi:tRNAThr (cytosine32-N3)-methyltransferase